MEGRGVILTWSIENWITVVLMAAAGYFLFAAVSQFYKSGGLGNALKQSGGAS